MPKDVTLKKLCATRAVTVAGLYCPKIMESTLARHLDTILLGPPQQFNDFTIFPLKTEQGGALQHIAMDEAMKSGRFKITEVSEMGVISEALAENRGNQPVLLVEGEELLGAKQNRVLASSILIEPHTRRTIPVLCSERKRWVHSSMTFAPSKTILPWRLRSRLLSGNGRRFDFTIDPDSEQTAIWEDITALQTRTGVKSRTEALFDVVKASTAPARKSASHFTLYPGQQGLFVFYGDKAMGFDLIPNPATYAKLHEKLVRSYTFEPALAPVCSLPDPEIYRFEVTNCLEAISHMQEYQEVTPPMTHHWFTGKESCGKAAAFKAQNLHTVFCFN